MSRPRIPVETNAGLPDACDYVNALSLAASTAETLTVPSWASAVIFSATADFYLAHTPTDGIPYWDTGAPGLAFMGEYLDRDAEPFNPHEPVDSSAAAISAQGLIRLGNYLKSKKQAKDGARYLTAGLNVAKTLFSETYTSGDAKHQGLLLHSVYHRPNGWDHVPKGQKVPCGEACMWGDYHARELALLIQRMAEGKYYTFFGF